jgi:ATP-dependent DNA helicase RecQ
MNAAALLKVDSEFGGLSAGPRAPELLRRETRFEMRPEPARRRRDRARAPLGVHPANAGLLAALKKKRSEIANQRRVPAYVIFSDRTLIDMAARRPATLAEFGDVFGVGRAKTESFGEMFIALIAANRALSGDAA